MAKQKRNIYDFLKGTFLTDDSSSENWKIIILFVVLALLVITSAHRIDKKVISIAELNKKKRELRAEYVDTGIILMRMKMESNIREKVKNRGILQATSSPIKIKVTN